MKMVIIRGLPGSGKSTIKSVVESAHTFYSRDNYVYQSVACSADDYFFEESEEGDKVYTFDVKKLPQAHDACREKAAAALNDPTIRCVIIDNTNTQRWEFQPYLRLAAEHGVEVTVISLFDGGLDDAALASRNNHSVPAEAIARMRQRFEHDWANADPRPPWER